MNINGRSQYGGLVYPKIKEKDYITYKFIGSDENFRSQIIGGAGKVSDKYSYWFNVKIFNHDKVQNVDWRTKCQT